MDPSSKFFAFFVGAGIGLVVLLFAFSAVIEWWMSATPPKSVSPKSDKKGKADDGAS